MVFDVVRGTLSGEKRHQTFLPQLGFEPTTFSVVAQTANYYTTMEHIRPLLHPQHYTHNQACTRIVNTHSHTHTRIVYTHTYTDILSTHTRTHTHWPRTRIVYKLSHLAHAFSTLPSMHTHCLHTQTHTCIVYTHKNSRFSFTAEWTGVIEFNVVRSTLSGEKWHKTFLPQVGFEPTTFTVVGQTANYYTTNEHTRLLLSTQHYIHTLARTRIVYTLSHARTRIVYTHVHRHIVYTHACARIVHVHALSTHTHCLQTLAACTRIIYTTSTHTHCLHTHPCPRTVYTLKH